MKTVKFLIEIPSEEMENLKRFFEDDFEGDYLLNNDVRYIRELFLLEHNCFPPACGQGADLDLRNVVQIKKVIRRK